ncbi:MAG TPA: hypothetical protein VF765_32210 [Polyangiaceae bacterium]
MRFSILAAGALAASVVGLVSGNARAQGAAPAFGQSGELAITWDQPLVAGSIATIDPALSNNLHPQPMTLTPIGFQYFGLSNNGPSYTAFSLAPAADYFVIDNLSVGAQVLFGIVSTSPPAPQQGTTTTLYGIAPQVGYNIAFNDSISFWPKLFFAFSGYGVSNNGGSGNSGTIGVFAPFLFHIATHFYAGIGPDFSTQAFVNQSNGGPNPPPINNPTKVTTFGAMGTFGGWFNL